ncbi:MAG TPA: protein-methionine-sulfoxide reductase heme-binding subunit MsrQ [Pyrinomonadaceae bacterium]|nr:protein-methionine-sulfoxide reductase heme-binding subunit MsrQ [Pyrinomonadaceae bacterium]
MKDTRFSKFVLLCNGLVPLALMLWDVYTKRVGANPLEFVTRTTGMLTLVFLMLTLAVSPIRHLTRLNWLVKFRRMLGLFAFFYGFLHLATYVAFDRYFKLTTVPGDVVQRPFIALGMLAFFLMVPLAITSTNKMVKRLGGKRWSQLHKIIYAAGIAGVVHFWLLVKSDTRIPLTFGFVLALLLAHRLLVKFYPPDPTANTKSLFPLQNSPPE